MSSELYESYDGRYAIQFPDNWVIWESFVDPATSAQPMVGATKIIVMYTIQLSTCVRY